MLIGLEETKIIQNCWWQWYFAFQFLSGYGGKFIIHDTVEILWSHAYACTPIIDWLDLVPHALFVSLYASMNLGVPLINTTKALNSGVCNCCIIVLAVFAIALATFTTYQQPLDYNYDCNCNLRLLALPTENILKSILWIIILINWMSRHGLDWHADKCMGGCVYWIRWHNRDSNF